MNNAYETSSPAELQSILARLVSLHGTLVGILQEEYAHMAQLDVKGLAEAGQAKQALLTEIWSLEERRIRAADETARGLGLAPERASLGEIADRLRSPESETLRNTRTALSLLVKRARELNARNMTFAEASLERIEQLKRNALGMENGSSCENYSSSGARQPVSEHGGRLLSTEA